MKLAILTTHPVQYYAPAFAALARTPGMDVRVFYGLERGTSDGLGARAEDPMEWDVPTLSGYDHEFLENTSRSPGTDSFHGVVLPTLRRRVTQWGADGILVYGWNYHAHLDAIRYFHGRIPVFFRGDSTLQARPNWLRRFARTRWLRWVYSHVDCAFAVGTENSRYFSAMGFRPQQIVLAPHAVDNARFAASADKHGARALRRREALGIPEDRPAALFVGKLNSQKGVHDLLSAFTRCHERTGMHLIFAGAGPKEAELRARATSRVHFLGFQNQTEMPVVYRTGDLTVLPSSGPETWGLAVNESMACRRAVVTSDLVGCSADLVIEGTTGWSFRAGCVEALESRLAECAGLGREGLRLRGEDARALIQDWSIERQAAAIAKRALNS